MTSHPLTTATGALDRAAELLRDLDRTRRPVDMDQVMHGVRHEVASARAALAELDDLVAGDRDGKVRTDAPETSRTVAHDVRVASGTQRHRILTALAASGPLTDWEVQELLAIKPNSERPRRGELVDAGMVQPVIADGGALMTREHGGNAWTLWEATELGRGVLSRIGEQVALAI